MTAAEAGEPTPWHRAGVEPVSDNVYRIPLPLPGDTLRAVNVYAVLDDGRVTLVDGGWARDDARRCLGEGLAEIGVGFSDIDRILVTHIHRDHYTLAIALRAEFGIPVSLGTGEQESIDRLRASELVVRADWFDRLRRCGGFDVVTEMEADGPGSGADAYSIEPPDDWLRDEDVIELGARRLQVIATPGHTRGHVAFADLGAGLLFAGDHVLPHITPSIGVEMGDDSQGLTRYLASLQAVQALPDLRLLPAHGPVTHSVRERVVELIDHHRHRLTHTEAALGDDQRTAFEVARDLLWTRSNRTFADLRGAFDRMLATYETASHLELLVRSGRVLRSEVDGLITYRRTVHTVESEGESKP
jgi:glyoxylase-like metal-dependent hydrolase (beta-lactamase superfamily II)